MTGFGCSHPRVHSQTSPGCLPHSRQPCSSIARSFHTRHQHSSRQSRPYRTCVRSLRAQNNERQGGGLDPSLEIAVPSDQRPVNELAALRDAPLYSWATLEQSAYVKRLGIVWLLFFALLGGPIAYQTFDPLREPIQFMLSSTTGALAVVAVAILRIYLGWAYVGNRLLSAAVDYEESGWYDGQTFVKPPEVLARDRLLGTYEVKPTLDRLKTTLLGAAGGLLTSAVLLLGSFAAEADARRMIQIPRSFSPDGVIYSTAVRSLQDLRDNDEAAAAEAEAQKGVPGYCGDRFFKAFAGGHQCSKFEQQRR